MAADEKLYDRSGPWILLVLPILIAAVPVLAFGTGLVAVLSGILLWGAATGVQDSTVKALVADLVPRHRRATAYGLFAAVQGAGALGAGPPAENVPKSRSPLCSRLRFSILSGALRDIRRMLLALVVIGAAGWMVLQVGAWALWLPLTMRAVLLEDGQ